MNISKLFLNFVKKNTPTILLWIGFILFIEIFTVYFISQERYIYAWDYAAYYLPFRLLDTLAKTGIINFFREILLSLSNDYNLLAAGLLFPFRALFGPSRIAYIIATLTLYAIPSVLLFAYMIKNSVSAITQNVFIISFASIITVLINPFIFVGVYLGFVDIFGVGMICFIYVHYFLRDKTVSVTKHILLGGLLALLLLFRRGYGFWIESFIVILLVFQLYDLFRTHPAKLSQFILVIGKMTLTSSIFFSILYFIAKPIALKALFENYSNIYGAFKDHPFLSFTHGFYTNSGPVPIILFLVGMYIGFSTKKIRRFSVFIFIQAIVTFILLARVQSVMDHQYYFFYPTLLYFMTLPIIFLLNLHTSKIFKFTFCSLLIFYFLVNFVVVFIPASGTQLGILRSLFPSQTHYPLVRNDFNELGRLVETLFQLNQNSQGNIYLFSISNEYNNAIVRNYCQMYTNQLNFCNKILFTSDVDKRDGFPIQLLASKYVLVSDVKPFFLGEKQHVVDDLMDDFLSGKDLSKSFRKLPYKFMLDNDINVYIFAKYAPISLETIDSLSKTFQGYYPNNPLFVFSGKNIIQKDDYAKE